MPARKRLDLSAKTRERIKVSMIVNRLQSHVMGEVEMSSTQLQAARILLAKALPDLQSIEHSGQISTKSITEMTDEELIAVARRSGYGASEEAESTH